MIIHAPGNIFNSPATHLVIPVNCIGVMGAGLAKQVAKAFHGVFAEYYKACRAGYFSKHKKPLVLDAERGTYRRKLVMLPTKFHFEDNSSLELIYDSLQNLEAYAVELGIGSLAIPRIGCGCGKQDWDDVLPLIEKVFGESNIPVYLV